MNTVRPECEHLLKFQPEFWVRLTDFELKCWQFYLAGVSYKEMAERLNCRNRQVNNALQRCRRKLRGEY